MNKEIERCLYCGRLEGALWAGEYCLSCWEAYTGEQYFLMADSLYDLLGDDDHEGYE